MSTTQLLLIGLAAAVGLYLLLIGGLLAFGRRTDARAWAGFVPDCLVLVKRLLLDPDLPRSSKLLLGALVAYLAMPIDLVPDVLPIVGQLDDALLVALVLRHALRNADHDTVERHWPGPPSSLRVVLRLAGLRPSANDGERERRDSNPRPPA